MPIIQYKPTLKILSTHSQFVAISDLEHVQEDLMNVIEFMPCFWSDVNGRNPLWTLQVFRHWNRLAMVFLFLPRIAPLQQSLGPWPQGRGAWLEVMHGMETLETGGLHGFFNRMRSCDISDLRSTSFANHWTGQSAGKDTDESDFFFSVWHEKLRNFEKRLSRPCSMRSIVLACDAARHVLMQARNANQGPSNRQHVGHLFTVWLKFIPLIFYSNLLPETPWLTTHPNHPLAASSCLGIVQMKFLLFGQPFAVLFVVQLLKEKLNKKLGKGGQIKHLKFESISIPSHSGITVYHHIPSIIFNMKNLALPQTYWSTEIF